MRFRRRPKNHRHLPFVGGVEIIVSPTFRSRDECPTCNSLRDKEGRLPIGHCGPDCVGRQSRDAMLRARGVL